LRRPRCYLPVRERVTVVLRVVRFRPPTPRAEAEPAMGRAAAPASGACALPKGVFVRENRTGGHPARRERPHSAPSAPQGGNAPAYVVWGWSRRRHAAESFVRRDLARALGVYAENYPQWRQESCNYRPSASRSRCCSGWDKFSLVVASSGTAPLVDAGGASGRLSRCSWARGSSAAAS